MDKKLQDLLDSALRERFGLAYQTMKEESDVDAADIDRLVALSEEIEHHPGISDEAREIVQAFLSADSDNNDRFQKYLYRQGAKDCVALLQELDLIK